MQAGKKTAAPLAEAKVASAPRPPAKTSVVATPSRGAQHAAQQIQSALASEQAAVSSAHTEKRTQLLATGDAQVNQIVTSSQAEYNATIRAIGERETVARAVFAQARGNVQITQAAEVAAARGDAQAAENRLRDGTTSLGGKVKETANAEGHRMRMAALISIKNINDGARKLTEDINATHVRPREVVPDLTNEEQSQVYDAMEEAKSEARGAVVQSTWKVQGDLTGPAIDGHEAFSAAADKIAQDLADKMPEAFDTFREGGDATAELMNKMAVGQLTSIDSAERDTMHALEQAHHDAQAIHDAGVQTAAHLRQKVVGQMLELVVSEGAASTGLAAMADQALQTINNRGDLSYLQASRAAGAATTALQDAGQQLLAALTNSSTEFVGQINGVGTAFTSGVGQQRDKLLTAVDGATSKTAGVLATSQSELVAGCTAFRAAAVANYVAAETTIYAKAAPEIAKAESEWKAKASEFVTQCAQYESTALSGQNEARAAFKGKLEEVVRNTVEQARRSTWEVIWDHVVGWAKSLGAFFVVVLVVAVGIMVVFGTAFAAALGIALAIVGVIYLAIGLLKALYTRFKQLWNNDWPWYAKILGIPAAFGVAVGDVLGLSQIAEAIRGKELISDRELTREERIGRATDGVLQVVTLGLGKKLNDILGSSGPDSEPPPTTNPKPLGPGEGDTTTTTTTPGPGETTTTTAPSATDPTTTTTTEPPKTDSSTTDTTTQKPADTQQSPANPSTTNPDHSTPADPSNTTSQQSPVNPSSPDPAKPMDPSGTTLDPTKTGPDPAKTSGPDPTKAAPKPAESPFLKEAVDTSKSYAKETPAKQVKRYDFANDPDAKAALEKTWQDAFNDEYIKQREAGNSPKDATKKARSAADKATRDAALARSGEPLNLERAHERARADRDAGKAFKTNLDPDTDAAKKSYESGGGQGKAAKQVSPELAGKTVPEMEAILDADAAAGKCTKTTGTTGTTVRKPMTSYLYPDGTLVRIKPQGDAFTSTPKYSVEVTKQPGVSGTQDDIAFKVESDGRATPKGPEDVNNPYSELDNPNQYRAYNDEALKYGHLDAKPTAPAP